MSSWGAMVAAAVFTYLVGCLQGGYNAGRVLGRSGFLAVFLIDCLKGATAVWLATALGSGRVGMAVAAIAVVLGHIFPLQLQFRGGKGASSALGALLVLTPPVAITSLIVSADAARTLLNITGDAVAATVVANHSGEVKTQARPY